MNNHDMTDKQKQFFKYSCDICLWQDHYFPKDAAKTLRELIKNKQLKPMMYSANYIYKQVLQTHIPQHIEYQLSMFMNPE